MNKQQQIFSIQYEISLTLANLAQNLKVLRKRVASSTPMFQVSSSFASFSSFDCRPAYDIANIVSTTSALLFSTKIDFTQC